MVSSQHTPNEVKVDSGQPKPTIAPKTENDVLKTVSIDGNGEIELKTELTPQSIVETVDPIPEKVPVGNKSSEQNVAVGEAIEANVPVAVSVAESLLLTSQAANPIQKRTLVVEDTKPSVSSESVEAASTSQPALTQPLSVETQQYLVHRHQPQIEETPLPPSPPDFLVPHSIEAEEALLGSLITNPDMYDEVAAFLNPDDFFLLRNSWLYEAISRIRGRNEAVDHLTVNEELKSRGLLKEVGPNYTIYLLNNTPISRHAVVYGRIIERASIRRRLIEAAGKIATIAFSENRDIHEVIHDSELTLATVTEQRSSQQIVGNINSPKSFLAELQDRIERKDTDGVTGVRVGYQHLDQLLGGLQAGELYVVAGRSKSGKSAFMLNMARGAAANGSSIGFFSLEMNLTQLQRRLHAMETGINTQKMRLGAVAPDEYETIKAATRRIQSYDIYWDETPRISVLGLRTKCRYLKRRYDVSAVVIDYLQLLKPSDASLRRDNRERQLATMAEMLKEMARELNIAVVVAAQLNREIFKSDNKRPRIEHIRDSDAIVHNADVVMMWHCPQTMDENAPKNGAAKLYIEKHRDGPQTELDFHYDLACQKIREVKFETIDLSKY